MREKVPARQVAQVVAAISGVYAPAGQSLHPLAPPAEKRPGGQEEHAVAWICENDPARQLEQFRLSSNVPAGQGSHMDSEEARTVQLDVPEGQTLQSWRPPACWTSR